MSKWKCGICGDEFENYHAQGFDDIIYCPLCYFKEEYKRANEMLKVYKKQLQQKENIIKEVREEVKEARLWNWTEQKILIDKFTKRLLEILDKENKNE